MASSSRNVPPRRLARTNSKRTEDLTGQKEVVLSNLMKIIEVLRAQANSVNVEGVKENVERSVNTMIFYRKARDALQADWRARIQVAGLETLGNKMTYRVEVLELRVMGVLDQVNKKLIEQDGIVAELIISKVSAQPEEQKWTEVVKRPRSGTNKQPKKPVEEAAAGNGDRAVKSIRLMKSLRARSLAIMISKEDEQFPELLKMVISSVNLKVTGNSNTRMRKTTKENLLIEINGGANEVEVVKEEVVRSLGQAAKVQRMVNEAPIEVRDLENETMSEEVLSAVLFLVGEGLVRLVSLRKTFGSAKTAVMVLPSPL